MQGWNAISLPKHLFLFIPGEAKGLHVKMLKEFRSFAIPTVLVVNPGFLVLALVCEEKLAPFQLFGTIPMNGEPHHFHGEWADCRQIKLEQH